MTAYALVVATVLGLLIGSFLNVVAYRVPAGISLMRPSQCPACEAPVRPWQNVPVLSWLALRGRCARCRHGISVRYPLIEIASAVLFALGAWWWVDVSQPGAPAEAVVLPASFADAWTWIAGAEPWTAPLAASGAALLAWLWFLATGFVLTIIDLETRRLPRNIVRTALFAVGALLALSCALGADWGAFVRAVLGMILLYIVYALLWIVKPGGMGGGDVRLAGLVGLMLGWFGWAPLVAGAFAAFVLGGVYGVALILTGRATRRSALPFGPWMIVGAVIGAVVGAPIGEWYLSLLAVG